MNHNQDNIVSGIVWLVALSWVNRLLGFLAIIILARLLSPADFGIMAIIAMSIQLTETLTNIGSEQYFIQKNHARLSDLNCAWTSNLLIKLLTSVLFAIVSPLAAYYFSAEYLIPALLTVASLPVIDALRNGWLIKLKKELNYKRFVSIATLSKLLANVAAIIAALLLKNYWALIIGALLNTSLYCVFSYVFIKQRATFGLNNWHLQFDFSKWIILKGLIGHVRAKFDVWYASSFLGVSALGGYNFAKDLVLLPSRELLSPISEVFFTAIANSPSGSDEQKLKIRKSITIIYIIGFPIAFGWTLISLPFCQVVLGEQWVPYSPIISILGFLVLTFSVGNFISQVMIATGKVKSLFYYDTSTLLMALLTLFVTFHLIDSIYLLAWFRVAIGLTILSIGLCWLHASKIITLLEAIKPAILPFFASVLMLLTVNTVSSIIQNPMVLLISIIVIAAAIYTITLLIGCHFNCLGKTESYFVKQLVKDYSHKIYMRLATK